MAKSENPKLDLAETCPELARTKVIADEYRNKGYSYTAVSVPLDDIDAIAATMLKLAEENKRLKILLGEGRNRLVNFVTLVTKMVGKIDPSTRAKSISETNVFIDDIDFTLRHGKRLND